MKDKHLYKTDEPTGFEKWSETRPTYTDPAEAIAEYIRAQKHRLQVLTAANRRIEDAKSQIADLMISNKIDEYTVIMVDGVQYVFHADVDDAENHTFARSQDAGRVGGND